jgi:intracellular sulfur oxidation DsrE/DsrF family protein
MMKHIILFLALFGLLFAEEGVKKVVFDLTAGNVKTFEKKVISGIAHQKGYYEGKLEELQVAVVIHGDAYKFFVNDLAISPFKNDKELVAAKADLAKRIAALSDTYEVEFLMCEVGMNSHKINKNNLYKFVKLVATSTVGLIDKQQEGYAYIPIR